MDQSPTFVRASMMRESEMVDEGSALMRTVPERIKGSWGMVMMRDRIISRGRVVRSKPSTVMVPEEWSRIRRRRERREDLPL